MPDAEPAAEVEHARPPGEPLEKREHALEREDALVDAAELRADVDVEALDLEPELPGAFDLALGEVGSQAELRLLVRGLDRAVRHRLDARRQAHEHAPHAGGRSRLRLTGRVEDDERIRLRSRPQLLLRLVVAVEHDPLARNSRRPRERELAERRDVGADALLAEQPQQRDVRERLRPVDDERARRRLPIGPNLRADRLLAVDEERRAVLLGELARGYAAERQLAGGDQCGFGKELEHLASIGIPMQELLLT